MENINKEHKRTQTRGVNLVRNLGGDERSFGPWAEARGPEKLEARRAEARGPEGRSSRPGGPRAGGGVLGRGAASPPPHQLGGLGERCKLPQRGPGQSPGKF